MDNILVGIIVTGALIFCIRSFIKTYRGQGGCNCSSGCSTKKKPGACSRNQSFKIPGKN